MSFDLASHYTQVLAAKQRIAAHIFPTPLIYAHDLSEMLESQVFLKCENLNLTGSFKIRGVMNSLLALSSEQKQVCAFSSGNHGLALAYGAKILGKQASILMPHDVPHIKAEKAQAFGAQVLYYHREHDDRWAMIKDLAQRLQAIEIPPFDAYPTIYGQGTVGLEIINQLASLNLQPDYVYAPCSGASLTSGLAITLKSLAPSCQVTAIEPHFYNDFALSLAQGHIHENPSSPAKSICDCLLTTKPGTLCLDLCLHLGVKADKIEDDWVKKAMLYALNQHKIMVEPGGAIALAHAVRGKNIPKNKTLVFVLSGGNSSWHKINMVKF